MTSALFDDHSVYFEIPAKDPLGREAIAGKLRASGEQIYFHWRFKDRTFRKTDGEMAEIPIAFDQVEQMKLKATLGIFKPKLIFQVTDPKLLTTVPGVDVGQAILHLNKAGKEDAKKFIKFVEYRKSEVQVEAAQKRMNNLEDKGI